mmetsp:Transcript_5503/g.11619  ORF Transcript_5503/g.11619 Transcript_5503/m.11619 type:complete len:835 (-) Transcript_5503:739-3243(-)
MPFLSVSPLGGSKGRNAAETTTGGRRFRPRDVHAVLGCQSQIRDVAQCLDQGMPLFAADNEYRVFLVVAQVLDGLDHLCGGLGVVAAGLHHSESRQVVQVFVAGNRSSVVEQNQAIARHLVGLRNGLEIEGLETDVHAEQTESQPQAGPGILDGIDAFVNPLQIQHDGQGPPLGSDPGDEFARAGDSLQPFLVGHRQGLLEGLGDLGNLPRVDVESTAHHPGARGKFAQDDEAPAASPVGITNRGQEGVLVGNGKLERDEIESVPDRCHQDDIGCLHQGHALLQSHSPIGCFLELDRARPHLVDPLDLLHDLVAGFDVIVAAFPGRDSDLDQDDFPDPFRAPLEEALHGEKLEGDALEAFQSIDRAEYRLAGMAGADRGRFPADAVVRQNLVEDGRFDPGVDAGHGHVAAIGIDCERVSTVSGRIGDHPVVETQEPAAARQEMAGVFEQVKAYLVGVEHSAQQVFAAPEGAEDFRAGKGRVQKDPDLGHGDSPRQVGRQDEQMEAVDPDQVAFVEALDHDLGKLAVDLVVGRPQLLFPAAAAVDGTLLDIVAAQFRKLLVSGRLVVVLVQGFGVVRGGMGSVHGGHVVQHRPQDSLAKAVVHFTKDQRIDPYRDTVERTQAFLYQVSFVDGNTVVFRLLLLGLVRLLRFVVVVVVAAAVVVVPVPPLPLDDTDPGHPQVGLHAEEGLVVPIGGPLRCFRRLVPVNDDRQERADHHQSIGGVELHGLADAPPGVAPPGGRRLAHGAFLRGTAVVGGRGGRKADAFLAGGVAGVGVAAGRCLPRCRGVGTAALDADVPGIPAVEGPLVVNVWFLSLAFSQDVVDDVGLSRQQEPQR